MRKELKLAALSAALVGSFCMNGNVEAKATKTSGKKVALTKKEVVLKKGNTTKIKLKNASKKVKWTVKNKKLVKITKKSGKKSEQITVKGIKTGTAKIVAEYGKKKYTVTVKVQTDKKNAVVNKAVKTDTAKPVTTDPSTVANKITGTVFADKIKVGENLKIQYTVTGTEDKKYVYDEAPGTLERLESGKWEALNKKTTAVWKELGYVLSKESANTLEVPLESYYEDVTAGHYRYTKDIGGNPVSVEFEIIKAEDETTKADDSSKDDSKKEDSEEVANKITGTVLADKIKVGENLKIRYTVTGTEDKKYVYDEAPGTLERLESGKWVALNKKTTAVWKELGYVLSKESANTLEVPLESYYEDVTAGHYRYTKDIGGNQVSVEFEIIKAEDETTKADDLSKDDSKKEDSEEVANKITGTVLADKIKVGENLKIRYTVTGTEDKKYVYDEAPGTLERLESGKWVALNKKTTAEWKELGYVLSKESANTLEVPLESYYEDVTAGHYRYTKDIGGNPVSVEFEIQ